MNPRVKTWLCSFCGETEIIQGHKTSIKVTGFVSFDDIHAVCIPCAKSLKKELEIKSGEKK